MKVLRLDGQIIEKSPTDGFICLTDMWITAGRSETTRLGQYLRLIRPKRLIEALERQFQVIRAAEGKGSKTPVAALRRVGRGPATRTFAHPIVALDYAEALSPDLSIEVKRFFLEHRRGALSTLQRVIDGLETEVAKDQDRVSSRVALTAANRKIRGEGMSAGCMLDIDFKRLMRAHYFGLYEMGVTAIKERKGLPSGASLPDYMGLAEMAGNLLAKAMEVDQLRLLKPNDPREAGEVIESAASRVRGYLLDAGLAPEDLPAEPHVRTARQQIDRNVAMLDVLMPHMDDFDLIPESVWEAAERAGDEAEKLPTVRGPKRVQ